MILIINNTGEEATQPEFDDFRKTYKKWIQGNNDDSRNKLQQYFLDPLVILIWQEAVNIATVFRRVKMVREEINRSFRYIRTSRENANQPFTNSQLQFYIQRAADTFCENPHGKFDIYKASWPTSNGLAGFIVEFRRAIEKATHPHLVLKRHRISLDVLGRCIRWLVVLWISRQGRHLLVGANAQLRPDLRPALVEAQTLIDGELPCAAETVIGSTKHCCGTVRYMHTHGTDVSSQTEGESAVRWFGDFITDLNEQRESDACRLVSLADGALHNENFEEELLLHSCVDGTHVMVPSCDPENNLAALWFTSYNRPMLEDESDDLVKEALWKKDQPTRKLIHGRVPNNHLSSAKEPAATTSVSGTYFPAYLAGNRFWVDCGTQLNGPAAVAIEETRILWPRHKARAFISLGCGELRSEKKEQQLDSLVGFLSIIVNVDTDAELKCHVAIKELKWLQPDSSGCCLRRNLAI
uniref:PNPLA domain-containing protein n=1 Tax=Physcomitrium patens TaxID=3218 RepID=A0A2K1IWB1_PHYPA|nr:hypothetical protein PHYPA_025502 [Physcomitrium patens]